MVGVSFGGDLEEVCDKKILIVVHNADAASGKARAHRQPQPTRSVCRERSTSTLARGKGIAYVNRSLEVQSLNNTTFATKLHFECIAFDSTALH